MSSLASLFNSSAMLFTIDFYKRFKPNTSEKKLVGIGQMATVAIVILGILWIPIMRSVGDVLYTYLQDVQSVLAPGIAAAFLLGICWKRTSAQGGMWGLIAGMIIGLTRLGAKVYYSNVGDVSSSTFKYLFYDMNWLFFLRMDVLVLHYCSNRSQPGNQSSDCRKDSGTGIRYGYQRTKSCYTC